MNTEEPLTFEIQDWGDYVKSIQRYESMLRSTENYLSLLVGNKKATDFHKAMAQHSLMYQAWSQGISYGQSYFVDVGLYVRGGGEFIVNTDSSKALTDFKVGPAGNATSIVWRDQIKKNVNTFRSMFFLDEDLLAARDFSPIYLAEWILDDWFEIEGLILDATEKVLDIGCGIGAQNILINQVGSHKKNFTLIDTNAQSIVAAKNMLRDNGLRLSDLNKTDQYDLIISLRSCCFLYGFEEYEDIFRNQTKTGTVIIVDISHYRLEETLSFFESFCSKSTSLIKDDTSNHRYVFVR